MTWASHLAHPVVGCRLVEVRSKIPFEYLETPLSWQIHQVCHSYISYQGSIKWSLQTSTCSLDCPGSAHWIFYMTKFMTLRPSNSIFPYSWLLIIHLTKFIPNFISHSLVPFFIFKMCFFASNSNLKKKKTVTPFPAVGGREGTREASRGDPESVPWGEGREDEDRFPWDHEARK